MQGGDPEEDNIESVDDVTGSDPDLIQQEVITYYFSIHLFLKLQIVIEKKILSEVPNNSGKVHHLIIHNSLAVMHTTATFRFLRLSLLGDSHMKSIEILIRKKKN